jgi:Rrf2 family protein
LIPITIEYAFRAIGCLASSKHDVVSGEELAQRTAISTSYLPKILLQLKRGGLVKSTRGIGGGYWLARPAEEITLAEVAQLVVPAAIKQEELSKEADHGGQVSTGIHRRWRRCTSTVGQFLEATTLADLLQQQT